MIYPGTTQSGDELIHAPSGVRVRLIGAAGEMCLVRIPGGGVMQYQAKDLYAFNSSNVGDSKGPQLDPRAGSIVGTGPLTEKVSGAEFAKRVLLEAHRRAHPSVVGTMVDNYGSVVNRGPLPAGTPLIRKADRTVMTLIGHSAERDLYVCQLPNGAHGVYSAAELVKGDGSAVSEGNSLRKSDSPFRKGARVRVQSTGELGTVLSDGDNSRTVVVEFTRSTGSGMEVLHTSEISLV